MGGLVSNRLQQVEHNSFKPATSVCCDAICKHGGMADNFLAGKFVPDGEHDLDAVNFASSETIKLLLRPFLLEEGRPRLEGGGDRGAIRG